LAETNFPHRQMDLRKAVVVNVPLSGYVAVAVVDDDDDVDGSMASCAFAAKKLRRQKAVFPSAGSLFPRRSPS